MGKQEREGQDKMYHSKFHRYKYASSGGRGRGWKLPGVQIGERQREVLIGGNEYEALRTPKIDDYNDVVTCSTNRPLTKFCEHNFIVITLNCYSNTIKSHLKITELIVS